MTTSPALWLQQIGEADTLPALLAARARERPDDLAIAFVGEDGVVDEITAERFDREARAFAAALAGIGVVPGDVVILVLQHSRTLLAAFWGAMYAGAIPSIFPFLSEKLDAGLYFERVQKLVVTSGAGVVITFPAFEASLRALLADLPCQVLTTEAVAPTLAAPIRTEGLEAFAATIGSGGSEALAATHGVDWSVCLADDIAFLQHSSGTTGLQKGVALSHRAVLNQIVSYGDAIRLTPNDVVVSWLPLYHDMGLIAGFVMPLATGVPLVLMSPFHWVRQPGMLLRAIDRYRATLCWLPNFAYNHIARSVRQRDLEGLDLGSLRAVINCSEPVRYDSHRLLLDRLSAYGLVESALGASYAMAENTFAVTQTAPGRAPIVDWVQRAELQTERRARPIAPHSERATPVVSCGAPIRGTAIRIVDSQGSDLPERRVGEILVRSDCMLTGYHRRPDLTSAAIRDGWYWTGDMGYLAGGELYVSGRKNDLIIVGGKNLYPQDLEAVANTVTGLYPGRNVAFGVPDERLGSEAVVMVCELASPSPGADTDLTAIESDLRRRVVQTADVTLADVVLVEGRWLIKTSSGKIARADNRRKYLEARREQESDSPRSVYSLTNPTSAV